MTSLGRFDILVDKGAPPLSKSENMMVVNWLQPIPELTPYFWHDVTIAVGAATDRQPVPTPTEIVTSCQGQGAGFGFE